MRYGENFQEIRDVSETRSLHLTFIVIRANGEEFQEVQDVSNNAFRTSPSPGTQA
jgi:hypothetical protein